MTSSSGLWSFSESWLACLGVTLCVMEATSTYWKPPSCLLEDAVKCWLVDTAWLCKLAERGMLRPSFVPPPWQRELRDLCRYRRILIQERTREKQRAEKLLEDTQIKGSAIPRCWRSWPAGPCAARRASCRRR